MLSNGCVSSIRWVQIDSRLQYNTLHFGIRGSNTVLWFTNREVSRDGGVVRSGPRAFTVQNTDQGDGRMMINANNEWSTFCDGV